MFRNLVHSKTRKMCALAGFKWLHTVKIFSCDDDISVCVRDVKDQTTNRCQCWSDKVLLITPVHVYFGTVLSKQVKHPRKTYLIYWVIHFLTLKSVWCHSYKSLPQFFSSLSLEIKIRNTEAILSKQCFWWLTLCIQ